MSTITNLFYYFHLFTEVKEVGEAGEVPVSTTPVVQNRTKSRQSVPESRSLSVLLADSSSDDSDEEEGRNDIHTRAANEVGVDALFPTFYFVHRL